MATSEIDLQNLWAVFSDGDDRIIGQPGYTIEFYLNAVSKNCLIGKVRLTLLI